MWRPRCLFGLLLVAVAHVGTSSAISCYQCNSAQDKRCIGDVNNQLSDDLKRPCPERADKPHILCRKIKQVIDFEVNGLPADSRVIRSCGWDDSSYADRCYQRSGFGGRQEVCACKDDFCNGGAPTPASAALVLAGAALTLRLTHP